MERLGRVGGTARIADAAPVEQRAVADLLGLATLPGDVITVSLDRLDRALRSSRFGIGLPETLELLGGPLRDRPAERDAERRRRTALWEDVGAHPLLAGARGRIAPEVAASLRAWLDELRSSGLLRRLAGEGSERALLDDAFRVLGALPRLGPGETRGTVRRGVLAASTLGSSHALDPGRPVATLVLRALALLSGRRGATTADAAERRELWERAGVVLDDLSSQVLVLGLAPAGDGPVAIALRELADAAEPARITLRQLAPLTGPDRPDPEEPPFLLPDHRTVHVCENPVVVQAAADRFGDVRATAPPVLICPEGVPSLAARDLLVALARQGARILYHGDFDWAGVRIAGQIGELLAGTGAFQPWRFGAADYREALDTGAASDLRDDGPVPTPWEPDLETVMAEAGLAVEEEAVLENLLGDLG